MASMHAALSPQPLNPGTMSDGSDRGAGAILVVDDEPVLVEEISEFLIAEGYTVHSASDGASALALYRAHPPGTFAVVVTDLRMPGLGGDVLARAILDTTPQEAAVEIIVMTGHGAPASDADTPAGIFSVLRKPLRLSRLQELLIRARTAVVARRAAAGREVSAER